MGQNRPPHTKQPKHSLHEKQIYRVRAALSFPAVPSSQQDLALTMASLEHWIMHLQPSADGHLCGAHPCRHPPKTEHPWAAAQGSSNGRHAPQGSGATRLSTCFFGGLNYPDVAFDDLPLLAYADYYFRRRKRTATDHQDGYDAEDRELSAAAAMATAVDGAGVTDRVSPYGAIGRLFLGLCPDLGADVAPWLADFAGGAGLAPREDGGRLGEGDGRVKIVFVSSRFGNHGTTKALAGLMRLLPRDYFEVRQGDVLAIGAGEKGGKHFFSQGTSRSITNMSHGIWYTAGATVTNLSTVACCVKSFFFLGG